jgi:hypothetical protein
MTFAHNPQDDGFACRHIVQALLHEPALFARKRNPSGR